MVRVKPYGSAPDDSGVFISMQLRVNMSDISGRNLLLPILSIIMLVVMAGEAMLTAALPVISNEFEVPGVFESWILPMVLLVGAAAAPFIGTAGDQYGRKKLLIISLLIYLAGLVCGYYAWNIWVLLISRAMQGIGIGSFPLAYALIRDQMIRREADVGIGVISAMYGAGTFIGVIIGSFLIESFSWRSTYVVLIPVTVILILLSFFGIRDAKSRIRSPVSGGRHLDWVGFITLLIALILGLSAVSVGETGQNGIILRLLLIAGAGFVGILFIREEMRSPVPLVDLLLVRQRPVLLLIVIGSLTNLVFLMLLQEMPFLIQSETGLGLTAGYVGLILMPGTLCDMLAGPLTGRLVVSRGVRLPCLIGSLFLIGALLLILPGTPGLISLTIAWMIFSAGMSVMATACMIAIIDFVPKSRTAEATGFMQSVQTIGGMAGPVFTGLVLATMSVSSLRNGQVWTIPASETFVMVHEIALLIAVLIFICSFLLRTGIQKPDYQPVR